MKKLTKITSVMLLLAMLFSFPLTARAQTTSGSIFTSSTYTHQSQFDGAKIIQGVDLSKHNGTVDFAKMKKAGVKYVILRAGYRGWADEGTLNKDSKFEEYIKAASKQGLSIGIYFYSQAITTSEAKAEADYTVNVIKNCKKHINLPVAFDYEFAEVEKGRFDSAWRKGTLDKTKCTSIAKAFCKEIKAKGYQPMIYANKSFLSEVLDGKTLGKTYPIWLANYATKTTYDGSFYIWQFSSTGKIDGVSGNVDSNFLYSSSNLLPVSNDFTADAIADCAYTGSAIMPNFNVKYNGKLLIKGNDYYVTFNNNINIGTATVTVTGVNGYKDVNPTTFKFLIVPTKAAAPVLTKRGVDTMSFNWAAHSNADGYRVSYVADGKLNPLATVKTTSCSVSGLTSAHNYHIVVQAYKVVNGSVYYGIKSDELYTMTKPAKVKTVKTASRTNTSIKLKWTKQSQADKYIVYKYNAGDKKYEIISEVTGGKNNTFDVTGLKANTKYKFKIRAVKVNEKGKTMNGSASAAFADYTSPNAPKLKSAYSNETKKITVKHRKTSGAYGYQVMWSTTSTFTQNYKKKTFYGSNNLTNKVTAYKSGGSYYVRVRSFIKRNGKNYYSPWSDSEHVYTK